MLLQNKINYIKLFASLTLLILGMPLSAQEKEAGVVSFGLFSENDLANIEKIPGNDIDPQQVSVDSTSTQRWKKILERVAVKTNLLYYAVLMPNIELEYKFAERWSAAFEINGAWYAKKEPHKVYRVATYTPEVRYWFINRSRWHGMYGGVFFGLVPYDLCNGRKGHEGDGFMVGVSAGYMWRIADHFSLDAALGLGYFHANDKEYIPADGHYLYQLTKKIGYFGPVRLKLSLVYRFNTEKKLTKKS